MREINILNKNILYIGPASFHYDRFLIKKLIEKGAHVNTYDFEDLNPTINLFTRINNKLSPGNWEREVENHKTEFSRKVLSKTNYDYVLVRQGYQVDEELAYKLKSKNPGAKFINFHWDSIRPEYDFLPIIKYFDKVFSFDYKDCKMHPELKYLPLFYIDDYETFRKQNPIGAKTKYDLLFIGAWRNKERLQLIEKTENLCKTNDLSFFHHLYIPLKYQIKYLKKGVITKKAKTKILSHQEILSYFSKSNTIIDFPSSFQTGLTMRTFEALGAGKKLVTTNPYIMNEPFYNPEYIDVIDINNFSLNIDFIKNEPKSSLEETIKDYSISAYINKLFN